MSDLATYYDESLPPSLWGGGSPPVVIPPVANDPTGATPGEPGTFTPAGADVPADLSALQALGALGQTDAWTAEAFVELGDGSNATWDGAAWAAWTADVLARPPVAQRDRELLLLPVVDYAPERRELTIAAPPGRLPPRRTALHPPT